MPFQRASGVLAHPTSFPGPHGIGDLGDGAFRFIDWLSVAGQQYWQVMPLGPTGYGDSPYAAASSFAGNPLLVSLSWLVGDGLLRDSDLVGAEGFPEHSVNFGAVIPFRNAALRKAFDRFRRGAASSLRPAFEAFVDAESSWLGDFALYMSLKSHFGGKAWTDWDERIRLRDPEAVKQWTEELESDIRFHEFVQFQFDRQWSTVKSYANERGIRIIGDIPIFVAHDSADVWASRELFRLDETGQPTVVSGVPPDLFSADGQRWGNPMFDWPKLAEQGYEWWIGRVRALMQVVDVIRIDHFRGFAASWTVPSNSPVASAGHWERGPGRAVFDAIAAELGDVPIIVEDLGLITRDVNELRQELGFPGMKVLQFAFNGDPYNDYLPHRYETNSVVYVGTHDNQTTEGWFAAADERTRRQVQTYLGRDGADIAWDLIRAALSSTADLAIMSLQDVMRLGDEARMNTPGTSHGNWSWRFHDHQLHSGMAAGIGELTSSYGRRPQPPRATGADPYDYTVEGSAHVLR